MKPTDVQLPDRERVELVGDRDRDQRDGSTEVADDQDRAAVEPIHPDAGRQAEQDERQELDRADEAELERRDLQEERGDQRDGQRADLRAELADRLAGPELQEVGMAQEPEPGASGGRGRRGHVSPCLTIVSTQSNSRGNPSVSYSVEMITPSPSSSWTSRIRPMVPERIASRSRSAFSFERPGSTLTGESGQRHRDLEVDDASGRPP